VITVGTLARLAGTSEVGAQDAINTLLAAGPLHERTGMKRGRVHIATEIVAAVMADEARTTPQPENVTPA
jgi:hypothetical protein